MSDATIAEVALCIVAVAAYWLAIIATGENKDD